MSVTQYGVKAIKKTGSVFTSPTFLGCGYWAKYANTSGDQT